MDLHREADNLISVRKTGRLLDVDIHPDLGTLLEHKALSTWCRTFMHTREKDILFLNALKISLAATPQEGPCHVMFVGILHTEDHKELNTCEFKSQDTTKLTCAIADSRTQFSWSVMTSFVRMWCLCLASQWFTPLLSIFVTMSLSKPIGVVRVNRWTRVLTSAVKAIIYEALGLSRHIIDLEFDEEHMKAERLTKAPDNAGIDPGTIKMKTWYQEPTRESDDSQLPSSSRASDALSGTDRTSYQVREPRR